MTAYDLFKKAYMHYSGQFMRHLWTTNKEGNTPKAYISQSFTEVLEEYSVDYAYTMGFKLSYSGNSSSKNIIDLRQIDAQAGY